MINYANQRDIVDVERQTVLDNPPVPKEQTYSMRPNSLFFFNKKQAAQICLLSVSVFLLTALFTNLIGLGIVATAAIVSGFVLIVLGIQVVGVKKKVVSEESFSKECLQIDSLEKIHGNFTSYLSIDSLHEHVKDKITGVDLVEQVKSFVKTKEGRSKDLMKLKNAVINCRKHVTNDNLRQSVKMNLDQLALDLDRGLKLKFNGKDLRELACLSTSRSTALNDLELEYGPFQRPETVQIILNAMDSQYPELSLEEKNILLAHLHHGVFFDIQKELSKKSMGAADYGIMDVIRREDGSFSLNIGLLIRDTKEQLEPTVSQAIMKHANLAYKRELKQKFGMDALPTDESILSLIGTGSASLNLDIINDRKSIVIDLETRNKMFAGDFEEVEF